MRARSPADSIEKTSKKLPKPKYKIGTKVPKSIIERWWTKLFLKYIFKTYRTANPKIRQWPEMKERIRSIIHGLKNPNTIEIIGINPYGQVSEIMPCNQCYLTQGQSHSGTEYCYQLLIRYTNNDDRNNNVCIITPPRKVWILESMIDKALKEHNDKKPTAKQTPRTSRKNSPA